MADQVRRLLRTDDPCLRLAETHLEQAIGQRGIEALESELKAELDLGQCDDVEPTDCDVEPTDCDVEPTDCDVEPTDSDVEPTDSDVEPTDSDVEPTDSEVELDTVLERLSAAQPDGLPEVGVECSPDLGRSECQFDLWTRVQGVVRRVVALVAGPRAPKRSLLLLVLLEVAAARRLVHVRRYALRDPKRDYDESGVGGELQTALPIVNGLPDLDAEELEIVELLAKTTRWWQTKLVVGMNALGECLLTQVMLEQAHRKARISAARRSVPSESAQAPSRLTKCGTVWEIAYRGSEAIKLEDLEGFHALAQLLDNPYKDLSTRLLNSAFERKDVPLVEQFSAEFTPENQALVVEHILRLEAEFKAGRLEALAEADDYRKVLEINTRHGKGRPDEGAGKRLRMRVQARLARIFEKIKPLHPELATHLRRSIKIGARESTYHPADDPGWVVNSTT